MEEKCNKSENLISVIIPIYNVESYLRECVESVINQTYKNLEIILVDDGSTDGCAAICDEYKKKDNRVKVIHKKNGGLSSARNTGLDIANGRYISFVDSDDFVGKHLYEMANRSMSKYNAQIYCFRNTDHRITSTSEEFVSDSDVIYDKVTAYKEYNNVYGTIDDAIWDKIFEASLFKGIRFPEGKICEDIFTFYKLVDKSDKIIYNNSVLYFYRARESSLSQSGSKVDKFFDNMEANEEVFEYVSNKYPDTYIDMLTKIEYQYIWLYHKLIIVKDIRSTNVMKKIKSIYKEVMKNRRIPIVKKAQLFFIVHFESTYKIVYRKHFNKMQVGLYK